MERLFREIPVCSHSALCFSDLKALRLTCRALAEAVAPLIFEHIHMGMFQEGLSRLENIANHPTLRSHVQSFTFHGDLLPFYAGGMREWERKIDLRPPVSEFLTRRLSQKRDQDQISPELIESFKRDHENLPRHNKTDEELEYHYQRYEQLRQDQGQWESEREGRRARDAFCKLPNLHEAVVIQLHPSGARSPVWRGLQPIILQTPNDWKLRNIAYEAEQNRRRLQSVAHLICLLEALAARAPVFPNCPVTSLASVTNGDAFWHQLQQPGTPAITPVMSTSLDTMRPAFRHLRRIDFRCRFFERENPPTIATGLTSLLKEAVDMEDLNLEFLEENMKGVKEDEVFCDVLDFMAHVTWPKLRKLSLHLVTTEQSLLKFLIQHGHTLRELYLIDSIFKKKTGTWVSLLRQLPDHLTLDTIRLQDLQDDSLGEDEDCIFNETEHPGDYEQALIDYVLNQGDFPEGSREDFYANRHRGYEASAEPETSSVEEVESLNGQDGHTSTSIQSEFPLS